jgi:hypothetical protein
VAVAKGLLVAVADGGILRARAGGARHRGQRWPEPRQDKGRARKLVLGIREEHTHKGPRRPV